MIITHLIVVKDLELILTVLKTSLNYLRLIIKLKLSNVSYFIQLHLNILRLKLVLIKIKDVFV